MQTRQLRQLTTSARLLVLLAMGAPILWDRDLLGLLALVGVASVWVIAELSHISGLYRHWLGPVFEAAMIGVFAGLALDTSSSILAALSMAPFVGGLRRGVPGVGLALSAQLLTLVATALGRDGDIRPEDALAIFTWSVAGLGLGFIATYLRGTLLEIRDELEPYLEARRLMRELIDVSAGMHKGLDAPELAGLVLSKVRDQLPTSAIGLYVPAEEYLVPLATKSHSDDFDFAEAEDLAMHAHAQNQTMVNDSHFAFPLGERALVAGTLNMRLGLTDEELRERVRGLLSQLRATTVQLDTALLFADFRDRATADVRQRLAREMHDGVAQDIASLGYLVDALAAKPADEKQGQQFTMLRERISKVVAEVRQSVMTLRTSVGEAESLGAAIGNVARHLSESSRIPIVVTLDEHSTRLRPEVEAELFRITQEAMNNAIKHAQCTEIAVHCQVHAPQASITVRDDGRGMQQGRSDSHGLKIMRERALLVDGELRITDNGDDPGLTVEVTIPAQ